MRCAIALRLITFLTLSGLCACQPRGASDGPQPVEGSNQPAIDGHGSTRANAAGWPFWPVKMRIHPLTRLLTQSTGAAGGEADQWLVETRIEFTDRDGQPAKAVGQLVIQIHENPAAAQERVKSWNTDLRDLRMNREHYDDVTRTYLFRLVVAPDEVNDQSQIRAMFVSGDGQQFEDRLALQH